jgi:hypothetical protein
MQRNRKYYIRKIHRYLGVFIGIQFLGWTISGLYFSWTDIHEIRGNHLVQHQHFQLPSEDLVPVGEVLADFQSSFREAHLHEFKLIDILGRPHFQVAYFTEGNEKKISHLLFDGYTGQIKEQITSEEAIRIADALLTDPLKMRSITLIHETDPHHEYRGKPLPVWAITYDKPNITLYVGAQTGTFQSVRHSGWRIFDTLWMFHTMDFAGRDNFNNWLLRVFSVFSSLTVFSGFTLYIRSSSKFQKLIKKRKK